MKYLLTGVRQSPLSSPTALPVELGWFVVLAQKIAREQNVAVVSFGENFTLTLPQFWRSLLYGRNPAKHVLNLL